METHHLPHNQSHPHENNNQNQQSHTIRDNYGFNSSQSDNFNSFLQPDSESAFSNPWDPDTFSDPQESINGYTPGNQPWNPNAIQPSNLLPVSNYGIQSRNLDQTFSGNPAFNYSGFDSRSNLSISAPPFDPNLTYGHGPLNDDSNFEFAARAQDVQRTAKASETVSPQALQNYPGAFNHVSIPDNRPVREI